MNLAADFAALATARRRELKARLVVGLALALIAYALARSFWPLVWYLTVVAAQAVDTLIFSPMRRPDAPVPTRARWSLCLASGLVNTALYSSLTAYLWFRAGEAGRLFAVIQACGGLLHVSLHMQRVRSLLIASLIPHAAYLLGLPLISVLVEGPAQAWPMTAVVVAGSLYCAHMLDLVRQAARLTETLRSAGLEAARERERAERASAAKSDFLATVSHEIRTPMNAVISAGHLLRRTPLSPEQGDSVSMLMDAGEILMSLLNDVLDISKIEAGKMSIEAEDLDLHQALIRLVHLWQAAAADKRLSLVLELSPDLPTRIHTDPLRLRQIVFNLLSNAVKFTAEGRVLLRATCSGAPDAGWIVLEVEDTGCGIASQDKDRLFSSFEQVSAGTSRRFGGTGLGLAISRRLAELLGGELTVESELGAGSTFRLSVPWQGVEADAAVIPAESTQACDESTGLAILVAEDHPTNRRIVAMLLEPQGWVLTMVENGAQAVEAAERQPFDVILTDMQMPVMDGLEAVKAIRAGRGRNAATPVVALTANALDHHRAAWKALGVDQFVTKPIDPAALVHAIIATQTEAATLRAVA